MRIAGSLLGSTVCRLMSMVSALPQPKPSRLMETSWLAANGDTLKMFGFPKARLYYGSFQGYVRRPHALLERSR